LASVSRPSFSHLLTWRAAVVSGLTQYGAPIAPAVRDLADDLPGPGEVKHPVSNMDMAAAADTE
jgi:hypothetical protein